MPADIYAFDLLNLSWLSSGWRLRDGCPTGIVRTSRRASWTARSVVVYADLQWIYSPATLLKLRRRRITLQCIILVAHAKGHAAITPLICLLCTVTASACPTACMVICDEVLLLLTMAAWTSSENYTRILV